MPCAKQQTTDNLPESNDLAVGLPYSLILLDDIGGHGRDDLLVLGVLVLVHVNEAGQEYPLGRETLLHVPPLGLQ
jgi:hypothetical protein